MRKLAIRSLWLSMMQKPYSCRRRSFSAFIFYNKKGKEKQTTPTSDHLIGLNNLNVKKRKEKFLLQLLLKLQKQQKRKDIQFSTIHQLEQGRN